MTSRPIGDATIPEQEGPAPLDGPFPTLPGTMQRSQVSDLLREIRRTLGLSNPAIALLERIIDLTRPRDWRDPDTEPVCYATQTRIAHELGCSTRQVRTHEMRLIRAGVIEDRRRANGSRSQHGRCGLGLSPLIALIPQLLVRRDQLRQEWTRQEHLVARRSVFYRRAKALIMDLQTLCVGDGHIAELTDAFLRWPSSRELRRTSLADLEDHLVGVQELVDRLEELRSKTLETSGRAEENLRSLIQDTTQATSVSCSAPALLRTEGKPSDTAPRGSAPAGADRHEGKREAASEVRNPSWIKMLTPERLRSLCSPDFRLYLDHETRGRPAPRLLDYTLAAVAMLPALGISPSAWDDAVDRMGDVAATLCVLIIDANRFHPVTPIRRPGGALRVMTRRHATGSLNLVGSLIGIERRSVDN